MDLFVAIAIGAFAVLIAELLLPTGGVLAAIGALGLIASGVLALESSGGAADAAGAALITLGVLSAASFYFVAGKVLDAHRKGSVRTGSEELVGAVAEARSTIDPDGQVWLEGTLWAARLADGGGPVMVGDKVRVEAVDGLTLVVRQEPVAAEQSGPGGS